MTTTAPTELRLRWITTLDLAASALQTAIRARTLTSDICVAEAQVLNREQAWLETVVWPGTT
jgi:hypothetical protein